MPRETLIQLRAGTAAEWAAAEAAGPALVAGETAMVDNDMVKGDGVTKVAGLTRVGSGAHAGLAKVAGGNARSSVATNVWGVPGVFLNTSAGTCRTVHTMVRTATDLRLVYGAWYKHATNQDTDMAAALPIKASIEVAGTIYRVTFCGSATATIDPGGTVVSDPIGLVLPAGTQFYVRTYVNSTAWYATTRTFVGTNFGGLAAGSDLTAPGSAAVSDSDAWVMTPLAILGRADSVRSVAVLGDSIASGQGATYAGATPPGVTTIGFVPRALAAAALPWTQYSIGGYPAVHWLSPVAFRRVASVFSSNPSSVLSGLGTNDLFAFSQTDANLQASYIGVWNAFGSRGIPVYQTTITPKTTSTDSWATVGNQTTASSTAENYRKTVNQWLRDGAPILAGAAAATGSSAAGTVRAGESGHPVRKVFDTCATIESAQDSGIWKAAHTADGTHPNDTGHAAMAAAVTGADFV